MIFIPKAGRRWSKLPVINESTGEEETEIKLQRVKGFVMNWSGVRAECCRPVKTNCTGAFIYTLPHN